MADRVIRTLALRAGKALSGAGWTVAVGESCTGGGVSEALTGVPGSSAYFLGGVVAYGNLSKTRDLDVAEPLLARHGAVSEEVAVAMAEGARRRFGGDVGIGTTGIAGPGGGTPEKPVGLVYIALASSSGVKVDEQRFLGSRDQVRLKASQAALDMVRRHLIG